MAKKDKEVLSKEELAKKRGQAPGPLKVSLENAIDGFQESFQLFEDVYKREKTSIMAISSRLTELRNERDRLANDVQKLKDTIKAFSLELPEVEAKIESRKKELKELINT